MFLRSKDGQFDEGADVPLAQMWELSQAWYGDRLSASFTPRSVAASQALLAEAGLTSSFWQLEA